VFHVIIIHINTVRFVCKTIIHWTTEGILSRWAFLERLWVGTDVCQLCFYQILPPAKKKKNSLTRKAKVKNWQCCLKRRPREVSIYVFPFASTSGGTTICFLFTRARQQCYVCTGGDITGRIWLSGWRLWKKSLKKNVWRNQSGWKLEKAI